MFPPGIVLVDRYRIIGLLGRGGMGEIYRADDLKLAQPVALKFLPSDLAGNAAWLARFHGEVRIARQVSHPNVCRVYDIGEVDGHTFLSMEYVDGEDLASLLRRIGRLPRDKGVEIARQLCAGLAAAHDRGVLHRDLKPANVMIDGRGKVRLTDFGIAGMAEELRGGDVRAGTPAYMAPEQIAGREVTTRSDIYSLGLVLYEIFTGKPAFEAGTLAELTRLQEESHPTSPSLLVEGIDPAVERTILRCLEKVPRDRPPSALAVAAGLPGGDPLAAALAAGETPSPEMVAAASKEGRVAQWVAWTLFALLIVAMAGVPFVQGPGLLVSKVPIEKSPEVLADYARNIIAKTGLALPAADSAFGYWNDLDSLKWLEKRDRSPARWDPLSAGRIGAITFWYRENPRPMIATRRGGRVGPLDPPLYVLSGSSRALLDERGRLLELFVVPPQNDAASPPGPAPDWSFLFAAAGLDPAAFTPEPSEWVPPVYADTRAAWKGSLAELPGVPVRVEASAYRGKPNYFAVIGPWTRAERAQPFEIGMSQRVQQNVSTILVLAGLIGAMLLARRSLISGRGDRRGATRMALYVVAAVMIQWALEANHQANVAEEFTLFARGLGEALFMAAFVWLLYLALEPAVRRRWPDTLISWSRLLAFRFRDPLIARDLLIGTLAGAGLTLLDGIQRLAIHWSGGAPPTPILSYVEGLTGPRYVVGHLLVWQVSAALGPMLILFLLVALRAVVKIQALAVGLLMVILLLVSAPGEHMVLDLISSALGIAVVLFILIRFGLHAAIVTQFSAILFTYLPVTRHPTAWYGWIAWACVLPIVLTAAYGLYVALGRAGLSRSQS
jgi:serine/threonine-protein kinase